MSVSTLSLPSHAAYHMPTHTSAPAPSTLSLTQTLLTHSPPLFALATQSPFLRAAGLGTLPKPTLSKWLSQDRLYAQSYVAFIGALIARVHLPHPFVADKHTSLRWRIAKLLSSCLTNIFEELEFFETVADKYGLDLEASPSSWKDGVGSGFHAVGATKQYEALFRAFGGDPSMSLLEGLVVLWATERCYLGAWGWAKRQYAPASDSTKKGDVRNDNYNDNGETTAAAAATENAGDSNPNDGAAARDSGLQRQSESNSKPDVKENPYASDLDSGALRNEFIPNWTSPDFEQFVQDIADVTDELAEREEAWRKMDVYKAVWEHVCEVERRFWPEV